MNTETNTKLLRQIGSDIHQWQAGGYPPGKQLFLCIWGLPTAVIFLLMEKITGHLEVSFFVTAVISTISLIIARQVTAAVPKTWEETLDKRLSEYQPNNMDAWSIFQGIAQQKGTIELIDVRQWYEHERASSGWPGKPPLHFLNNKANRSTNGKQNKTE